MTISRRFDALVARVPELSEHTVAPPGLRPLPQMDALERELSDICRAPEAPPRAFAALGNVLVREGRYVDALEAYRIAADLDVDDAAAHWACAEIAHVLDDIETSTTYRTRALARRRVFFDPLPVGTRTPVLLLLRDIPYSTNTPLEVLLDRERVALHKYYVEGNADVPLPAFDVAFCAFGSAHGAAGAIARTDAFLERVAGRINDPLLLERTTRESLAGTLDNVAGLSVAHARVVDADAAASIPLPALVRPVDTHAGDGFARIADRDALVAHLGHYPAQRYHVSDFVEYRSPDGWYRKFRVIFVDGVAYPYHLAISPQWMVHYQTAPMQLDAGLRAQELAFLEDPRRLVPAWDTVMPSIADAIGLDYFGIDATVLPDGSLLVFEADAAMLVHDEDARDVFVAKRPYVARIREALHDAIARRRPQKTP
ncbi:MAG TPA: hypothetical protein VIK27_12720 [Candidatus Aquilonibacter sp.]